MAAESNTGFHPDETLASALNRHALSFQSAAMNRTSEMIPVGAYFGMNAAPAAATTSSSAIMMMPGNPGMINSIPGMVQVQPQNSSASSIVLDSIPGLKHDTGLAVEWSVDEQLKLEEGLGKYADEPSILRYIKIAATLREKTVRDVALRCRWMTRKRRKAEEFNAGKKVNSWKDKLVESSSKMNATSALSQSMVGYNLITQRISGTANHLLEQNAQAFSQITANLSAFKLQDNIDLFCEARNNITAILNHMRDMPGIMSQMPPLPVCLNEDLASRVLPNSTQSAMFGSQNGIQLKQEPRC
uniref:Uncharacterized protein MANES_07G075900 n=1 Tax=Rhizophora mucronata TaxID=61149 RepID=A0A2P2JS44_RHIMU